MIWKAATQKHVYNVQRHPGMCTCDYRDRTVLFSKTINSLGREYGHTDVLTKSWPVKPGYRLQRIDENTSIKMRIAMSINRPGVFFNNPFDSLKSLAYTVPDNLGT